MSQCRKFTILNQSSEDLRIFIQEVIVEHDNISISFSLDNPSYGELMHNGPHVERTQFNHYEIGEELYHYIRAKTKRLVISAFYYHNHECWCMLFAVICVDDENTHLTIPYVKLADRILMEYDELSDYFEINFVLSVDSLFENKKLLRRKREREKASGKKKKLLGRKRRER